VRGLGSYKVILLQFPRRHIRPNGNRGLTSAMDVHNCKNRPPVLLAGQKAAADVIGDKLVFDLVDTNPRAIVVHQSVA